MSPRARSTTDRFEAVAQTYLWGLSPSSDIDLVIQSMLVSGLASESPVASGCFRDRNLNVVRENANVGLDTLKEQLDESLLRLGGSTFNHADLNNGILITPA